MQKNINDINLILKLLGKFDYKYITSFNFEEMKKYKFIIVTDMDKELFVICIKNTDKTMVSLFITAKLNLPVKYIQVSDEVFIKVIKCLEILFEKN